MAEWNYDQLNDEDDEENEETGGAFQYQFGTRDGLIFLIDCTKSMFDRQDEESAFELCIKCARNVIQNKIISSDKDLFGIVFFGTDKSQNPMDFKNICILHELGLPGAEKVLQLEKLLEAPANDDFETKFGHSGTVSVADALWTCSNMFSNCSQKLGYKRIMLFTNNDSPHGDDAQLTRQAVAKAEDLRQNGIDLELMHMKQHEKPFNVKTFYEELMYADEDEQTGIADAAEKFDELLRRVRAKHHKKRALSRIPLTLGEGLSISVGVYLLVRYASRPSAVKLYKKTNDELKTVTKSFLKETGEILMPQDMKKSQVYANKSIGFETEEVAQMKLFDKPGFQLMGFKKKELIKPYFHIRPAQFIYPDESSVIGSTCMFTAMLRKCLEKEVVAICKYIPRKNTPPRFVALWPQKEELDEHNIQAVPPGFHVIFLPFADDFRKLNIEKDAPRATVDQIDKAKELLKKLQFAFRSESFENPVLQQHYANVEAMALDRDSPEEVTDFTLPDEERIEKRAGQLAQEFKDLVFPDDYEPGSKRKGGGGGAGGKVAKVDDLEKIDIKKEAEEGRLGKLTVPMLKEFVKKLNIKSAGTKKADLIDAISDHFGL